jgi:hypothetical protein
VTDQEGSQASGRDANKEQPGLTSQSGEEHPGGRILSFFAGLSSEALTFSLAVFSVRWFQF